MSAIVAEPVNEASGKTCDAALTSADATRIHGLDNVRALAMFLGIYLHCAFAYANPSQAFWLATDTRSSVIIDGSIWFIHLFRMSLFFLLSGYLAKKVIDRKGIKPFLIGRCWRIALPFVLFFPFLLASFGILIGFSLAYIAEPRGLMSLIAAAVRGNTTDKGSPAWTTMHLWFLYYLFLFNLASVVLSKIPDSRFDWLSRLRYGWIALPLVLVPGVLMAGVPIPAPESFVPAVWPFMFYGPFYVLGWQLCNREEIFDWMGTRVWWILLGSLVLFLLYYTTMPALDASLLSSSASSLPGGSRLIPVLCTAYLSLSLTLSALILGRRYLGRRSTALAFLADASYWMYLVHLPIAMFLQILLIPMSASVWIKMPIVLAGTVLFCLATYVVFVRYTPIGWMLHGKRTFP